MKMVNKMLTDVRLEEEQYKNKAGALLRSGNITMSPDIWPKDFRKKNLKG